MERTAVRERLVDAAFDLFAERGFEHTTVEDIVARAGVGRTTFFRLFRSKEHVIFPDHERLLAALEERLSTGTPETAMVAVAEAARMVLDHYLAEGERARRRYALTRTVPALRDREQVGTQQYQRLFHSFLHRWTDDGPRTALRAELLAGAVVTAHNHVLRAWLRRDTEAAEDAVGAFEAAMAEVASLFSPDRGTPRGAVLVVRDAAALERALPEIRGLLA